MADYSQSQIDQMFQQYLGRPGSQAEHDFLKSYVSQDYLSPFQIGQYLQGTPEAQTARLQKFGSQFGDTLAANDNQILSRAADAANSSFAQAGRQFSTGQGNSVLQAGQQLAEGRNSALAAFYGNGYGNVMNEYAGAGNSALSRAYGLQDSATQYARDLAMYERQKNDYGDFLKTQNRQNLQNGLIMAGANLPGQLIGAGARANGISKIFG